MYEALILMKDKTAQYQNEKNFNSLFTFIFASSVYNYAQSLVIKCKLSIAFFVWAD